MTVDLQINPLNAEGLLEGQFELDVGGSVRPGQANFHVGRPINLEV